MLKKTASIVLVSLALAAGTGCSGCNSAWWQGVLNNPAEAVQTFQTDAQVALGIAQATWAVIYPQIPAAQQAQAQQDFSNAVITANNAITALSDAVLAAAQAQQANPDFTQVMTDVTNAIVAIENIIKQWTPQPDAGVPASMVKAVYGRTSLDVAIKEMKKAGSLR
jgi:hypothetical protein